MPIPLIALLGGAAASAGGAYLASKRNKNPAYDPNDEKSERYVTPETAASNTAQVNSRLQELALPLGKYSHDFLSKYGKPVEATRPAPQAVPQAPQSVQPTQAGIAAINTVPAAVTPTGDTPTMDSFKGKNTSEIAAMAAKAGVGLSDYIALAQANEQVTLDESNAIRESYGVDATAEELFTPPAQSTRDMYKEMYDMSGLQDIRTQVAEIDKRLNKKRDDLVEAMGAEKGNPWISQATRAGRLGNLQELAYMDMQNDLDEKQQLLDLYDTGVETIETQLGYATDDRDYNQGLKELEYNYLLGQVEREEGFKDREAQQRGLRYVPDYLQGVRGETLRQEQRADTLRTISGGGAGFTVGQLSNRAQQVYNNPDLLEIYTATEAGDILDELAANGLQLDEFTMESMGATQRAHVAGFDDLIRQGHMLETALDSGLDVGPLSSRVEGLQAATGFGDSKDYTAYRSTIDNMGSALLMLRSGAAVTEQEFERLAGFIPSKTEPEETAKAKIQSFYQELEMSRANYINRLTQSNKSLRDGAGVRTAGNGAVVPTAADNAYVDTLPNL